MFLFFVRGLTSDLGLLLSLASPWSYSCNMILNSGFHSSDSFEQSKVIPKNYFELPKVIPGNYLQ